MTVRYCRIVIVRTLRRAVCATCAAHAIAVPGPAYGQATAARAGVAEMIEAVSYGVPTSPAFALLPDQASEVTHLLTPSHLQGAVASWFDGTRLRGGAALDYRMLSGTNGNMRAYRRSGWRRIAWRSIAAARTAGASGDAADVLFAAGVRIPIVDGGDPPSVSAVLFVSVAGCSSNHDAAQVGG